MHVCFFETETLRDSPERSEALSPTNWNLTPNTVDGVWSAIGSSNFDDRSFDTNDEITLGIQNAAIAQRLDAVFEKYAPQCKEIELEAWTRRGLWHKLKDNAVYLIKEVL